MASKLDHDSFTELGVFTVPSDTRIPPGAINPAKDLMLLVHRGAGPRDTLSLWKLQGGKRWDADVLAPYTPKGQILRVAWSPDGWCALSPVSLAGKGLTRFNMSIGDKFAVGHSAKRVTVHQVVDSTEHYRYLASASMADLPNKERPISGLRWIKKPQGLFWTPETSKAPPPQLYPRGYDDPGSALYTLKLLPPLSYKEPELE